MMNSRILGAVAVIFATSIAITFGADHQQVTITGGKLSRVDAGQIDRLVKPYCPPGDSYGIQVKSRAEVEVWTVHSTGPHDGNGQILHIHKVRGRWKLDLSNLGVWTS